jgi:hypothetical protein
MTTIKLLTISTLLFMCGCSHIIQITDNSGSPLAEEIFVVRQYSRPRTEPPIGINTKGEFKIPSFFKEAKLAVVKEGYETFIFDASNPPKTITLNRLSGDSVQYPYVVKEVTEDSTYFTIYSEIYNRYAPSPQKKEQTDHKKKTSMMSREEAEYILNNVDPYSKKAMRALRFHAEKDAENR